MLPRQGQVDSYTLVLITAALLLVWRARPRAGRCAWQEQLA
jgi:hypothetical protein